MAATNKAKPTLLTGARKRRISPSLRRRLIEAHDTLADADVVRDVLREIYPDDQSAAASVDLVICAIRHALCLPGFVLPAQQSRFGAKPRCICESPYCEHEGGGRCGEPIVGCGISNNYCERCLANARAEEGR